MKSLNTKVVSPALSLTEFIRIEEPIIKELIAAWRAKKSELVDNLMDRLVSLHDSQEAESVKLELI